MFVIPFQLEAGRDSLWIVLEDENLDRIKEYDPAEVLTSKMPKQWRSSPVNSIVIAYATPEDRDEVFRLTREGDSATALRILSRGFRFRPETGDGGPYESIRRQEQD